MTGSRGRVMSNRGRGLNASFGAWCFMTMYPNELATADLTRVLMHRLALGAL